MSGPERKPRFTTQSGVEIKRLYTPDDLAGWDPERDLGEPGAPPFTRGIHATGHRGRLWTMRMFAGFGAAEDTNARFRRLIAEGGTGLSIAYDMPTLYGYDHDDPHAAGEFGTCGVAVSSLADMEILLSGLPIGEISTSMTINSPAAMIWAMYIVAAEKAGVPRAELTGTLQNDILKEFIAQKEYIFPPAPSLRLVTDTVEFGTRELPRWNTISISGYHIREAGSTAVQELAFTIADGIAYVEDALARGMRFDDFAPRLSFFFNSHNDFFEEIAKFRAARRIWHRLCTERFGAENERSTWMRFHTQTAGVSLTAQQPLNNLTRVAIQALAAILGGTQSLHTDAYDEAWAVPSEAAALLALRQQQILAEESGVANTVDPLGGSYFVEALTNQTEAAAWDYIRRIDEMGGMLRAVEAGYPAGRGGRRGIRPVPCAGDRRAPDRGRHEVRRSERGARHPAAGDHRRDGAPPPGPPGPGPRGAGRRRARAGDDPPPRGISAGRREPHAGHRRGGGGLRHHRRDVWRPARGLRGVPGAAGGLSGP